MTASADPTAVTALDRRFMAAAIRLARRNLGLTAPNPSVGAICVTIDPDGPRVLGRGVTALGGRPHAEPQALAQAGSAARGATLYVTLEPCSHWGKTPPCAEAIIAAGISRVVVAVDDPDPRVSGHGYALLRAAGITVVTGVETATARDGLAGHLCRVTRGRPHVMLKLAVSADGRIGRPDVGNVAITGPQARARTHLMRAEADAVLVGLGTARLDDPELTVRLAGMETMSPLRVVLDTRAELSPESRLVKTAHDVPVRLIVGETADPERRRVLSALGVDIVPVPLGPDGRIDLAAALTALASGGITSLMVEGGALVAEAFLACDLVDRIALFESDVVIGADGVASPAALAPALAARFAVTGRERCGADRLTLWDRVADARPNACPNACPST